MKSGGAVAAVVIVLVVGWFIFKQQFEKGPTGGAPPQQVIDVAGVRNDLVAIGQAERLYLASHGTYASIEELRNDGAITFSGMNRRGYNYVAEIQDGLRFRITATPADPEKEGWPTLSIDETMRVTQQ
ncbi:MAG: hypothetical protein HYS33_06265 [Acidobacteria bacterium]|nr:hypothetical protein [Acidobacteriota bacterium]